MGGREGGDDSFCLMNVFQYLVFDHFFPGRRTPIFSPYGMGFLARQGRFSSIDVILAPLDRKSVDSGGGTGSFRVL